MDPEHCLHTIGLPFSIFSFFCIQCSTGYEVHACCTEAQQFAVTRKRKKLNFAFKKSFPNLRKVHARFFTYFSLPSELFYLSPSRLFSRLYWYSIRLYWYRSVTVLLPGWVILMYWNCPSKFFSLGSWLVSALSTPNGGEGHNSATDLNSITNSSILLQCIQAASPSSRQNPQAKCCM